MTLHDAIGHVGHKGQTYFYIESCLGQSRADPVRFLAADRPIVDATPASAAMTFSSVLVIGNALRLRRVEL
jgi:hypothetical protein